MDAVDLLLGCRRQHVPGSRGLAELLDLAKSGSDVFARTTFPQHITAAACVVDPSRARVLMILSPKFGRWMLPGGHVDPGEMPHQAAWREFREECGTDGASVIPADSLWPANIDIHGIPANPQRGEPWHQHVDFQFILTCADPAALILQPDPREATEAVWCDIADLRQDHEVLYRCLAG